MGGVCLLNLCGLAAVTASQTFCFALALTPCKHVKAFVTARPQVREEARARLAPLANVDVHEGDGARALHAWVDAAAGSEERLAVMIDGPKGELAIHLARRLLRSPAV